MNAAATEILGRLAGARVVVLGDLLLDRFVEGSIDRISPEAPVPVLLAGATAAMPGGAGNVARNVAALGGRAVLIGPVGRDAAAAELRALLAAESGIEARLVADAARPTPVKTRFTAAGQQLLRVDEERVVWAEGRIARALAERVSAALDAADALVLSDYAKGALSEAVIAAALAAAAVRGKPVIVDPKSRDFARYRGATVLTPNAAEAAAAAGLARDGDEAAAEAGRRALAATGGAAVLVTRGPRGMTLVEAAGRTTHIAAEAREVFDVGGAGDTVIATFALAVAAGAELVEAARLANAAAGVAVGKRGTAAVTHDELFAALHRAEVLAADGKVLPREAAVARAQAWRREGRRIGFTNGCFDLVHPGHVRLLAAAKAACDRLIVAINSDASVRRLKGEGRPLQGEAARALVLASMAAPDLVTLFEEDTPLALIEAIRPDVLVKGADYRVEEVVGADLVRAAGGQVLLVPLAEGHSTTAIARLAGLRRPAPLPS